MFQKIIKSKFLEIVLIISSISLIFLLPWLFSFLNSKDGYYGLWVNKSAPQFAIENTKGQVVDLKALSGHYTFLMFGYTRCRDVCPMQIGNILTLKSLIGKKPVQFAFISLDPDRDSLENLKQYFEIYGNQFIALRPLNFQGSQQLAMKFNEYAYLQGQRKAEQQYEINHNGYLFLLAPDQKIKLIYTSTQLNHKEIIKDLTKLTHK